MELCQNRKSIRMVFLIRRKCDGVTVADVCATIPIKEMDCPNAWWRYGVNAYLHVRNLPTHFDERNRFTATPTASYQERHAFVKKALARKTTPKKIGRRSKKSLPKSKPAKTVWPKNCCQKCGYQDPQFAQGVNCPNCN